MGFGKLCVPLEKFSTKCSSLKPVKKVTKKEKTDT